MTNLETVDAAACKVAHAYAVLGHVAVVSRSNGVEVRVIAPQLGVPQIAEHMHRVANVIFDGPATVSAGNA